MDGARFSRVSVLLVLGVALGCAFTAASAESPEPECPEPDPGLEVVNTGFRTCQFRNCDKVINGELLFTCSYPFYPEVEIPVALCAHDVASRETRVVAEGSPRLLDGVTTLAVAEEAWGMDLNADGVLAWTVSERHGDETIRWPNAVEMYVVRRPR